MSGQESQDSWQSRTELIRLVFGITGGFLGAWMLPLAMEFSPWFDGCTHASQCGVLGRTMCL